jgi:hypothetical protein
MTKPIGNNGANGFGNHALSDANQVLKSAEQTAYANQANLDPSDFNQNGTVNFSKLLNDPKFQAIDPNSSDPNAGGTAGTLAQLQYFVGQMSPQQQATFASHLSSSPVDWKGNPIQNVGPGGTYDGGNHPWLAQQLGLTLPTAGGGTT